MLRLFVCLLLIIFNKPVLIGRHISHYYMSNLVNYEDMKPKARMDFIFVSIKQSLPLAM